MLDDTLVISGLASDEGTAEDIRTTLRAVMPTTIKFTDQIRVKEPTPPAPGQSPMSPEPAPAPGKAEDAPPQTPGTTTGFNPPPPEPSPQRTASAADIQAKACEEQLQAVAAAGRILFQ